MRVQLSIAISALLLLNGCDSPTTKESSATEENTQEITSPENSVVSGSLDKSDEMAKIAYAMGANSGLFLARNLPEFKNWAMDIDPELIKKGFLDSIENKSEMNEDEIKTVLTAFQEQIKVKLAEIEKQQAAVSAEANKLYLDANAQKEGVKTTKSGLQYRIISEGKGVNPLETDTVKVHYRGSLISGQEFDSSYARNKPAEFALSGVISGWTEGLQLIKEGGKIELVLPPEMGYGNRPLDSIPANSILVFEVELLEIIKPKPTETK